MDLEKYEIELTRLERQIVLYKYFNSPRIKGKINSKELYGIPVSTIYRDLRDLKDAGLVSIKWQPGRNGEEGRYVRQWEDEKNCDEEYDESNDSVRRVNHLHRLSRLCRLTSELWNEELRVDYYEGTILKGKTCKDHYKELYPELSDRTMERDFQVLSRVGFPVRYNRSLRYYEFFEEDTDWPWVGGVFYDKKAKKLKRIISEDTDCPKQELHMDEILDIREGLNRD